MKYLSKEGYTGADFSLPSSAAAGSNTVPLVNGPPRKWLRSVSKETYIALLAALGVTSYLIGRYLLHAPLRECQWPLFVVLTIGGGPLIFDLLRKMAVAEFGADLLAGLSILTSAILGEYLAGSIVVLMLSGGVSLEQYATRRASAVLGALAKRMPSVAHRRTNLKLRRLDSRMFAWAICWWSSHMKPVPSMALFLKDGALWMSRT